MFEFLFRKSSNKSADPAGEKSVAAPAGGQAVAPGTAIRYNPELIDGLKRDHQMLLSQFGVIVKASEAGDYEAVANGLETFRVAIQSHLLMENVRLYIYLEHQLANDAASHELIHNFRHEMDGIGKALVSFLAKYKDIRVDHNLLASFGRDVEAVGKVLVDRIQREESTLYPLYLPNY